MARRKPVARCECGVMGPAVAVRACKRCGWIVRRCPSCVRFAGNNPRTVARQALGGHARKCSRVGLALAEGYR